ncbi:aspartyl/asparaginyl beta-hydroxylase domain-containing protein [uncultured Sphingomonas sp.]|uniref:aspartyl/asparaginyl beta-hydroxylase domain-containing protein n=1 Tax=uncultured Sphingomonas sp. TaxID=158754 RepID=UPI0035CA366B
MTQRDFAASIASAAKASQRGDLDAAIDAYRRAIAADPTSALAHNALGNVLLSTGAADTAREYFRQAAALDPTAPELLLNLAKACRLDQDDVGEEAALDSALAIDQRLFMARLRAAELHERTGNLALAATHWGAVIALAPPAPECPPALQPVLDHARVFVADHMARFEAAIRPALDAGRERASAAALRRFDVCVDAALGKRRIYANDCHGLHYPYLPADEFFDRGYFPWLTLIEAQTDAIRAELLELITDRIDVIVPYVQQDAGTPHNKWSALDRNTKWGAFFLWRHGVRNDAACRACPVTAAAIERLPLTDIPGRAPTVFFSLLEPGAHIPPHTGVTNTRAIVHLPLIVPAGCKFRVGGDTRTWREGEAFAFDDTIEHEAWNDGPDLRAVLIFDTWNPHLSDDERGMIRNFFAASDESGFGTPLPKD